MNSQRIHHQKVAQVEAPFVIIVLTKKGKIQKLDRAKTLHLTLVVTNPFNLK